MSGSAHTPAKTEVYHCKHCGLIAAAPELLEAAAELERYLRETPHHNSVQAAKVRAVLAKARGEA